ncbi:glycosyltransferase family 9 protein [Hydrogenobacter hydrogenophilus]|uniref:Heptosyltransferase-2 n=1 Tax=Hydrogenobacter hydrogenophilus TaxID=35835 RepID=A0A285P3M3_9AQUI|nr:glycosyltransferase family 9 protein [Hydrogenobacter hydrogenophilus]SNZ15763.1 heptosyltransferase-2 [Hydrogenobacter hydrogenophilus]
MKILIWQTAYLGDVILTTPIIRTLKNNFPDAELGFVGRSFVGELLKGYPIRFIPFNKGFFESFSIIDKIKDHHMVLSPHISARSALLLFLSGIPVRIGFDRSELSWLYTHTVAHTWGKHEVERNLDLLRPLGIRQDSMIKETKLFVDEEETKIVREKFRLPEEYVVLAPFSNFPLKEWYAEGWIELAQALDLPKVLVGTEKDLRKAMHIEKKAKLINLTGKTSLRELLAVVSGAKLVISSDSSPVHIANALGIPAICVYTSTSPSYGFYPTIGSYLTPQIPCSPCSPNPKKCKTGSYECLKAVSPEDVIKKANFFL